MTVASVGDLVWTGTSWEGGFSAIGPTTVSAIPGDGAATLLWTEAAGADGYLVGRDGVDALGFGPWSNVDPINARSRVFANLVNGTTYTLYCEPQPGGVRKSIQVTPQGGGGGGGTGPGGNWSLVFSDEFPGSAIDSTKWVGKRLPTGTVDEPFNVTPLDANGEAYENAVFKAANTAVSGGLLSMSVTAESNTVNSEQYDYASGCITTEGKFDVLIGDYAEARIWIPSVADAGTGLWPRFWMTDAATPPEIDIAEWFRINRAGSALPSANYKWATGQRQPLTYGASNVDVRGTWHTYGCHRKADGSIDFYLDGVMYPAASIAVGSPETSTTMYLFLNLSVYRNESSSTVTDPAFVVPSAPATGVKMQVEWVRVWRPSTVVDPPVDPPPTTTAIEKRGAAVVTELATTAGSIMANMPTGLNVVAGDVWLAQVSVSSTTSTAPSGWTAAPGAHAQVGDAPISSTLYYRIVTGSEASTYTWTGLSGTSRATVIVQAYSGVNTTTPFDVAPSAISTSSDADTGSTLATSLTVPGITTATAGAMLISGCTLNAAASASLTVPPGTALVATTGGTGRRGSLAQELRATAGATGDRTWVESPTTVSLQFAAWLGALRPATPGGGGGTPTPVLQARISGPGGMTTAKTTDATSVRLKYGTDQAVTAGTGFTAAAVPDSAGWSRIPAPTGLTAGAYYYGRFAMKDADDVETLDTMTSPIRFRVPPVAPTSFSFCVSSCTNAADSAAMSAIAARNDDLVIHLGDMWYADGSGTTLANYQTRMGDKLAVANHASALRVSSLVYTPSDHDFAMTNDGNGGTTPTGRDLFNQVYRQLIPTPAIPATLGYYYSFTWGRVRFIVLDTRTFATNPANTDNSSKSMLGTVQKQWFKDTLTASTSLLNFVLWDTTWVTAASAGDDAWAGYTTERNELRTFISGTGKKTVGLNGDMHALAYDDGTNNGGIPQMSAAPLNNNASIKGGPYSGGTYPTAAGAVVQQYGRVVVTDNGVGTVSATFTGYDSANTVRLGPFTVTNAATVLLNTTYDGYAVAAPISNANMWNAIGSNTGGTGTFVDASVVAVAGRGNVINHHFRQGEYISNGGGLSLWSPLSQSVDEATISYDMRWLSSGTVTATNPWGWGGKLPGLCGIVPGQGNPPAGNSPSQYGWSGRAMWISPLAGFGSQNPRSPVEWIGYVYDPLQAAGASGQNRRTGVGWAGTGGVAIGDWVNVRQHYKMNDVQTDGVTWSANGIHEMYWNDVLVYRKTNQVFRKYTAGRITHMDYSVFFGGGTVDWAPSGNCDIQFDNLLITAP